MTYGSIFLKTLEERGFLYQGTDFEALDRRLLAEKGLVAYLGCDATADSFHVGNLLGLMALKWWQRCGGKVLMLLGGATTRIGDPSGRNTSRTLMTEERIQACMASLFRFCERFFKTDDGLLPVSMVNNDDWLSRLGYIEFLRDVSVHFSMNRMLGFEMVKSRIDQNLPLSFLEFNYMALQAYDFLHLRRKEECVLQFGGSDQWGNIVCGVELVRKVLGQTVFGLTWPLLETSGGQKMGKTAQGAVWLNDGKLSPFAFWQFWRNTDDADVERFLKLFTFLSLPEIASRLSDLNAAKVLLADSVTEIVHGAGCLEEIHTLAAHLFGAQGSVDVENLAKNIPSIPFAPMLLIEALERLKLAPSRSEGRRLIRAAGVKVQGRAISDETYELTEADFDGAKTVLVQVGKKRYGAVRLE